ncbi:glucose-6-phosphate 1-epimerase [Noviherbaspirillum humi]|uniref:Putative glucose-6-phosphate 1-epimerase n=1 Tax=Noviherbaspirillum humi TaxID=1688639 RepID=A0A239DX37_9BURK|nr:D-hexose-6-phosphate mutarotase [Noviherbaspirillum humi]SNS36538.1 glucose-6-phosphate 1-epimerase [Noviherbaspirillum humi]
MSLVISGTFSHDSLQGFAGIRLADRASSAFVARQGAQVLSWKAVDGKERLYLSPISGGRRAGDDAARLAAAIRGGSPVCFPQFSDRGPLLKHGFARALDWRHESASPSARFVLADDELTRQHWPHSFHAEIAVSLEADRLTIALHVRNTGESPWSFTGALHTYLAVDDILRTQVQGLENTRYQDATAGNVERVQQQALLAIDAEVDRVYLAPSKKLMLLEAGQPTLAVEQEGFEDTVVWNPGPEKCRALKDMPDEDWKRMLCIEAAQVARPVLLLPSQEWRGSQSMRLVRQATAG